MHPRNIDRAQALAIISATYPADSEHPHTRSVGLDLLEQAREACHDWRNEPDDVLEVYARLCLDLEDRITERVRRELQNNRVSLKHKLSPGGDV